MTALWLLAAFLTGMLAGAVSALLFFAEWANTGKRQARYAPSSSWQTKAREVFDEMATDWPDKGAWR